MRFSSLLQVYEKGKPRPVPDPMSPGFDPMLFDRAFKAESDHSPEDMSAGAFGGLIGYRVSRVFGTLNELENSSPRLSYRDIAVEVARLLNKAHLVQQVEHARSFADADQTTIEALRTRRTIEDAAGNHATPVAAMEALVDNAKHMLRQARDNKGFGGKGAVAEPVGVKQVVHVGLQLGSTLEMLRRQWHMVLWFGAHARVSQEHPFDYVIDARPSRLALLAAIDLDRRDGHMERNFGDSKNLVSIEHLKRKTLVYEASGSGVRSLAVRHVTALPIELQRVAADLARRNDSAFDPSMRYFLDHSTPELKDVPFGLVLEAWYSLSFLVMQHLREIAQFASPDDVPESKYSLSIETKELVGALATALEIDTASARNIVAFLTYKGHHQTLWTRPLLDVGGHIELLWFPIQGCHPMRLLHDWAGATKELEEAYGKKGHRYEEMANLITKVLHERTNAHMPYVALGPRLKVVGKRPNGDDVGDVDGAFIIENTLFIMECIAVQHPAEPFEFWLVQKELNEKREQVMAKKAFLLKHPEAINKWADRASGPIPPITRVVALVVSNSYLLEGEQREEPYFVHLDTIFNILYNGRAEFGGGFGPTGEPIIYRIDYLDGDVAPADAIIEALRNPIKRQSALAALRNAEIFAPGFDESDAKGIIVQPEMNAPDSPEAIRKMLEKCSFRHRIVELHGAVD
ncbi:MAG: hypothetical protein JO142_00600 [Burkholderiales bacterium]|nr:hypothetical protein [Burkholderiales bacterium]